MTTPHIAQKSPIPVEVEAGKEAVARTAKYEVKDGDMSSWLK